jgi:hypothetical protein
MLSSCPGVNKEFLPNFGLPDLPLEILSCKVLVGMQNDMVTACIVPPFQMALIVISSVSFIHAAF